jgi:hypothetical protein
MSLFIVPAMFTVVDDFQRWLTRLGRRGAAPDETATPAPTAVG